MFATLFLSGIGGDLNTQISQAAFQMAHPVIVLLRNAVLPMMMTITLVYTIARGYLNSASLQIDLGPLFRMVFIMIALSFYRTLVPMVGDSVYWISKQITGSSSNAQAYATLQNLKPPTTAGPPATPQQVAQGQVDQPSAIMSLASQIGDKLGSIASFSLSNWILELATGMVAQLVQVCFLFLQAFLLGFLFVVGPIAFTLSVLPGWGGLVKSWFQSFLSVHLWTLTFAIINSLFSNYSLAIKAVMASRWNTVDDYMAANGTSAQYQIGCIIFIVLYFMVPYMTSLIVGHAATDNFLSSATRMATSLATPAAAAGGAAASVAGGMAQGAGSLGGMAMNGMRSMFGGGGGGGGGAAAGAAVASGYGGGAASMAAAPPMLGTGQITSSARMIGQGASLSPIPTSTATRPPAGQGALGMGSAPMGGSAGTWGGAAPANPGAPNRTSTFSSAGASRGRVAGTGELPSAERAALPPNSATPLPTSSPSGGGSGGGIAISIPTPRTGGSDDSATGAVLVENTPPTGGSGSGAATPDKTPQAPFMPGPPPRPRGGSGSW